MVSFLRDTALPVEWSMLGLSVEFSDIRRCSAFRYTPCRSRQNCQPCITSAGSWVHF